MSDCCGNPYVRARRLAFNPSLVRLYGRPFYCDKTAHETVADFQRTFTEKVLAGKEIDKKTAKQVSDFVSDYIRANLPSDGEEDDAGLLYPADETSVTNNTDPDEDTDVSGQRQSNIRVSIGKCYLSIDPGKHARMRSIGIIYGYSYEGFCYKLPKPSIMYLPKRWYAIKGDDCGCDCGFSKALGYVVWPIDKRERVIALDVRSDDIKTIVLDENMPGNRSPLAYSQVVKLAPQRQHE